MKKAKPNYRKLTAICAVLATIFFQSVGSSVAIAPQPQPPSAALIALDLGPENRILDAFVTDLIKLDKGSAVLRKKDSLTSAEFEAHQRAADALKRRLSEVQDALREVIRKLKAAGEWDEGLDARVLTKIGDPRTKELFRRDSFKKSLEDAASQLSNDENQIDGLFGNLRNKVKAQLREPIFGSGGSALSLQTVRVGYTPAPSIVTFNLRCRLTSIRVGVSGFVHGQATQAANDAANCACHPDTAALLGLDCAT
jgi:hypothetical protein